MFGMGKIKQMAAREDMDELASWLVGQSLRFAAEITQNFKDVPPILAALGTILAFLLMNLEIADYFTAAGAPARFEFGGNFGREMTYTICWALFALVVIVIGIAKKLPAARYAAMALLCITLIKLFFHDLAQLSQLYRIGAFIGVAVIAMLASFAYQKFFSTNAKPPETTDENKL